MDASIIVAGISALASGGTVIYTARSASRATQRKSEADAQTAREIREAEERAELRKIEAEAYDRARHHYEGTLTRMDGEITRQSRQIDSLQRQVARLIRQVTQAGLVPATSSEEET